MTSAAASRNGAPQQRPRSRISVAGPCLVAVAFVWLMMWGHGDTANVETEHAAPSGKPDPGSAYHTTLATKDEVFSWLRWSPPADSELHTKLTEFFPGALPGKAVVPRVVSALQKYGVEPKNTIYGQSLCSDEINNERGGLVDAMQEHWGHMFPLGGISGAPFVGRTGFGAFSHHVPENGNVVLLFGPHVGMSPDGEIGKYLRHGQHSVSTACGANIAAYTQLTQNPQVSDFVHDMEQSWLRARLEPHIKEIQTANDPMVELALKVYRVIETEIMHIVNTGFGDGYLILIGGVQINLPGKYMDHFFPLHFSVRSATMQPVSLLDAFH